MPPFDDYDNDDDTMDLFDDSDNADNETQPWDGVSEPKIDDFETFAEYDDAMTSWKIDSGIKKALQPAQGGQGQELTPYPDDPNGADRADNEEFLAQAEKEKADAEARGDAEAVRNWSERARMTRNELKRMPETPKDKHMRDTEIGFEQATIDAQLFGQEDSRWENKRLQADSAIVLSRANSRADNTLRLPLENGEFGDPLPCRPKNMCKLQLSPEQMADFQLSVYQSGEPNDPDSVFRRSWAWLRESGLDTTATRNGQAGSSPAPAPTDRTESVNRALNAGRQAYSDFDSVVFQPDVPFTDTVIDHVVQAGDDAPGVFYRLAQDPDEVRRLDSMHPERARERISEIAREVSGRSPNSRIKDVSGAPTPIKPTDSVVTITNDPEKMSQAEYERWRMAGSR